MSDFEEEFDALDPPLWGSQEEESIAKVEAEFQATQQAVAPQTQDRGAPRQQQQQPQGFEPARKKLKLEGAVAPHQQQGKRILTTAADVESQDLLPQMRVEGDRYVVSHSASSRAAGPSSAAADQARRSPTRPLARLGPGRPTTATAAPSHHPNPVPSKPPSARPQPPPPAPDDFRITHRGGPPKGIGVAHSRTLANAHADDMDVEEDEEEGGIWDVEEIDRAEREAVASASQQHLQQQQAQGARSISMGRPTNGTPGDQKRSFARSVSGPAIGLRAAAGDADQRKAAINGTPPSHRVTSALPVLVEKGGNAAAAQAGPAVGNEKEKALAEEVERLKGRLNQLQHQNEDLNKKVQESVRAAQAKAGEVAMVRAEAKRANAQAASQAKENSNIKQKHEEQLRLLREEHQSEMNRFESSMLFEQTALSTSAHASRWSVLHSSARRRAAPPSAMRRGDLYSQSHSQAAAASLGITTPTKRGSRSRAVELGASAVKFGGAGEDEESPSRRGSSRKPQMARGSDTKPNRLAFNSFVDDAPMPPVLAPLPHRRGKSSTSLAAPPAPDFGDDDGCLPDMDVELARADEAVGTDASSTSAGEGSKAPPLYLWAVSNYMKRRKKLVALVLAHHSATLGANGGGNDGGGGGQLVARSSKIGVAPAGPSNSSTLHRILHADVSGWASPKVGEQEEEERRYLEGVSTLLNALTASAADDAEQRFVDLTDVALFADAPGAAKERESEDAEDERRREMEAFKWEAAQRIEQGVQGVLDEIALALRSLLGVFVRVADYPRLHDTLMLMMHLCITHPSFVHPLLWSDVVSSSTLDGLTQLSLGAGSGGGDAIEVDREELGESGPRPTSSTSTTALRNSTDVVRLAPTLTRRLVEAMHNSKILGSTGGTSGGGGEGNQSASMGAPTLLLAASPHSAKARPIPLSLVTPARGTAVALTRQAQPEAEASERGESKSGKDELGTHRGLDEVLHTLVELLGILTAEVKAHEVAVFKPLLGKGSALYTLLDSKRPPLLCARVIGVLTNLAAHADLWSLVLASEPDSSSANAMLRRPASLRMLDLIASRMVPRQGQHLTPWHHELHRSAVIFLTQLSLVHDDASRVLAESPPVLAALVKCLHLDTTVVWSLDGQGVRREDDEDEQQRVGRATANDELDALIERICIDLRLLHLLFSPPRSLEGGGDGTDQDPQPGAQPGSQLAPPTLQRRRRRPPVDLAARLSHHETSILFNGVRHAFALALSRIAWADEPRWVDAGNVKRLEGVNDLALELLELVLSPDEIEDAWRMYESDDDEDEGSGDDDDDEALADEYRRGHNEDEDEGFVIVGAKEGKGGAQGAQAGRGAATAAARKMTENETDSQTQMEED